MAELWSQDWDEKNGVCRIHWLPAVPCPACLANAEENPNLYLRFDPIERGGLVEILLPEGFNPAIHNGM